MIRAHFNGEKHRLPGKAGEAHAPIYSLMTIKARWIGHSLSSKAANEASARMFSFLVNFRWMVNESGWYISTLKTLSNMFISVQSSGLLRACGQSSGCAQPVQIKTIPGQEKTKIWSSKVKIKYLPLYSRKVHVKYDQIDAGFLMKHRGSTGAIICCSQSNNLIYLDSVVL